VNTNSKLVINTVRRYRVALTYLLLLTTAYGALVGTVHSHGPVRRAHPDVFAVRDSGGSESSEQSNSLRGECSMCQLQRQLFDGFVQATLFARISLTEIAFVPTPAVAYASTLITPRSSRAPPQISA